MNSSKDIFGLLQKLGKAVMLPVSVLPVAGILLGLGTSDFAWMPDELSLLMAKSGGAIFEHLPLLFAIGVAIGLAGGDGVAALAATVGFFVLEATLRVISNIRGFIPSDPKIGEFHKQMADLLTGKSGGLVRVEDITLTIDKGVTETGVFGGILVGIIAAVMFNKYYRIQLPPYLGFFAGKRFVPIATAFAAIALGVVLSFVWQPIGAGIQMFSNWATEGNTTLAVFIYGFVERSLIPFGLHHIWNVPFYFEMGSFDIPDGGIARGDINRFMAGDPTAGILGGAYLFKMWGLPAAALAIWHTAKPERRAQVGGIMMSAALTSFLTGITEPIEFSFMFVAPLLYLLHAFLAGTAFMVFYTFGGLMGTSFSHGLFDLVILWKKGTNPSYTILLGLVYAAIYYGLFSFLISKFDIKTPGREDVTLDSEGDASGGAFARQLVLAFGGRSNITALDACITRLRVSVAEPKLASTIKLKALGASGVLTVGNSLQAIFGPLSENLKTDMEQYLKTAGEDADLEESEKEALRSGKAAETETVKKVVADPKAKEKAQAWVKALGGSGNIKEMEACAVTRVRVAVKDGSKVDKLKLESEGVDAVMALADDIFHLIVGPGSEHYLRAMKKVA